MELRLTIVGLLLTILLINWTDVSRAAASHVPGRRLPSDGRLLPKIKENLQEGVDVFSEGNVYKVGKRMLSLFTLWNSPGPLRRNTSPSLTPPEQRDAAQSSESGEADPPADAIGGIVRRFPSFLRPVGQPLRWG